MASVEGRVHAVGDAEVPFTIMSVAKPFTFALVCDVLGPDEIQRRVGVNATGLPFNSLEALEVDTDGRTNPMVNPGAIATASFAPGESATEKWRFVRDGLSRFAGRPLALDEETFESASATNYRNRELAASLARHGGLGCEPAGALDVYTRQSCLAVTARDLAVMGATLADGGVNPVTGERVVSADTCRYALAVMTTAGLYETSGDWLYDVGLPGKSGIGGGIVTVSPGKGGLGTFSPLLDECGQQRARAARRAVPLPPAGTRPLRLDGRVAQDAALQVGVALEPAHREEAPDGRQVEGGDPVEDDGRERGLLRHPGGRQPDREAELGHADSAGHRHERREQRDGDVDQQQVGERDVVAERVREDPERHREEQLGREAAAEEEPELVTRTEAQERRPDVGPPAADALDDRAAEPPDQREGTDCARRRSRRRRAAP